MRKILALAVLVLTLCLTACPSATTAGDPTPCPRTGCK